MYKKKALLKILPVEIAMYGLILKGKAQGKISMRETPMWCVKKEHTVPRYSGKASNSIFHRKCDDKPKNILNAKKIITFLQWCNNGQGEERVQQKGW